MRLLLVLAWSAVVWAQQGDPGQALQAAQALANRGDNASIGASIPKWMEAVAGFRLQGRRAEEIIALRGAGDAFSAVGDGDSARKAYEAALKTASETGDIRQAGLAMQDLGNLALNRGELTEATTQFEQSMASLSKAGDPALMAEAAYKLCLAWVYRKEPKTSIPQCRKAAELTSTLRDNAYLRETARFLLGAAFDQAQDFEQARTAYLESAGIARAANDKQGLAMALNNLGADAFRLGRYREAADSYTEALNLTLPGQRSTVALNNLSNLYQALGDYAQAVKFGSEALAAAVNPEDRYIALNTIGSAQSQWGHNKQAREALEEGLKVCRAAACAKDKEAILLANLGLVYGKTGETARGVEMLRQAVEFQQQAGVTPAIETLATAYFYAGDHDQAIVLSERALARLSEGQNRRAAATQLGNMMDMWAARGYSRPAIYYGKRAVNIYQAIRGQSEGLSAQLMQSYLRTAENVYRQLADLLIGEGRLSEAQTVLALLKQEEFQKFVQRDAQVAGAAGRIELTPAETAWKQTVDDRLFEAGRQYNDLLAKATRSPEEDKLLDELAKRLEPGNQQFRAALEQLQGPAGRVKELQGAENFVQGLADLPAGTVAIYTLVADTKFRALLVTPGAQRAYEFAISSAALNRKIFEFRQALQSPAVDPRPLAKELYGILIGPRMAEDLRQAGAKTLMWSLDGALRYVPVAALHDGSQYLVEQYRLSVFTPGTETLAAKPSPQWNVAAFGVTKGHGEFQALPAVEGELKDLVKDPAAQSGVLPGRVMLDEQFTASAMNAAFRNQFRVVHIASHFNFRPGDETQSFLLLGDGAHLSLAELRSQPVARGVELLALSACNTGVGDSSGDGKEVEGFGMLAQKRLARSVLASLWEVADESTSLLMRQFYRIRESEAGLSKAEALRRAQLALLRGEVIGGTGPAAARGVSRATPGGFARDAKAPFAHPYFWAPFFLMGNWL